MSATKLCIHDLPTILCDLCSSGSRRHEHSPADVPSGHIGNANPDEVARASRVRPKLLEMLGRLAAEGYDRPDLEFAAMCRQVASERDMETWTSIWGSHFSVRNVARGGAAKHWTLDLIEATIEVLEELLPPVPKEDE